MEAAALILVAAVVGLAFLVVCLAWGPREAPTTTTRPASSNRKSGRTRADS